MDNKERQRIYWQEYYRQNRDTILTQNKRWYQDNKLKALAYGQEYYYQNKDKYYPKHKERYKETSKEYRKNNPDKVKAYQEKQNARRKNSVNSKNKTV